MLFLSEVRKKYVDNQLLVFVQLEKPVRAEGNVEVWLMTLMVMAQLSLHGVIRAAAMAIQDSAFRLIEFLENYPAQVSAVEKSLLG